MGVGSHMLLLLQRLRTTTIDRLRRDWVTEIDRLPRDWVTEYRVCPSCGRLIAIDRPAGDRVRLEARADSGSSCVRMSVAGSMVHLCRNDHKPGRRDPNGVARVVASQPRRADVDGDQLAETRQRQ